MDTAGMALLGVGVLTIEQERGSEASVKESQALVSRRRFKCHGSWCFPKAKWRFVHYEEKKGDRDDMLRCY